MSGVGDIEGRAYAARVAQRIAEPAQAILGYQDLIVEQVRPSGPAQALEDLEKVLTAARDLNVAIEGLMDGTLPGAEESQARVRHDLRTPMNAILGYSELVVEEFADVLSADVVRDIETLQRHGRALLRQIDTLLGSGPEGRQSTADDQADHAIAVQLARTMADPHGPATSEVGHILVVDDQQTNCELLATRLRRDGHVVTTAMSGRSALDILERGEIDLALVDILMPDINGIELLDRIKSDGRFREIPVLMISGLTEHAAVLRCIAIGAEDYLPKPVDAVLLRARISACLERARWRQRERQYLDRINAEKARVTTLLHAMLPVQVVRRLQAGEELIADRFEDATIIFADLVNFTPLAARTTPASLLHRLDGLFTRFDELAELHGVEKIKTIGDAYMAAAGVPEAKADHARAAVAFARAIIAEAANTVGNNPPLRLRVGMHSGPVIAGLIGRKRFVYDIWGHTVNLASRLETYGHPGRIQISQSTLTALGGGTAVESQGEVHLKGIGAVATFLISE